MLSSPDVGYTKFTGRPVTLISEATFELKWIVCGEESCQNDILLRWLSRNETSGSTHGKRLPTTPVPQAPGIVKQGSLLREHEQGGSSASTSRTERRPNRVAPLGHIRHKEFNWRTVTLIRRQSSHVKNLGFGCCRSVF